MALDSIFYKEWTVNNRDYKLSFIPADPTDLSSPTSYELPDYCYIDTCVIEAGYDDDLFLGLPLADMMNLEINMSLLEGGSGIGGQFATFLDKVLADTNRTINGVSVTIPNVFILEARDVGDASYDELLFIGSQDSKPPLEYEVTENTVKAKVQVVSLVRAAMERTTIDMIKPDITTTVTATYTKDREVINDYDRLFDYYYAGLSIYSDIKTGELLRLDTLDNLTSSIEAKVQTMVSALSRGLVPYFGIYNTTTFFPSWTLYKADITAETNNKGASIDGDETYYIAYAEDLSATTLTINGGLFSTNQKNATFYEYDNVWDLLKAVFETSGSKWYFFYSGTLGSTAAIDIEPIHLLEPTGVATTTTLTNTMLHNTFDLLNKGGNAVNKVIATYKDVKNQDIEDVTYGNNWTQAEDSIEVEMVLHNGFMAYDEDDRVYNRERSGSILKGQYEKSNISWRTLFAQIITIHPYAWVKVAGECVFYVDNSTTFTTSTVNRFDPLYTDAGFKNSVVAEVNQRQLYDSMSYPLAQGLEHVFGNATQGMLKVKTDVVNISPAMIGDMFAFDINNMLDHYTFSFSEPSDYTNGKNLVLTSVTTDYATGISEATFFIRGD